MTNDAVSGVQPPKDTTPDQKNGQEGNEGLKKTIQRGDPVMVRTAFKGWKRATALSGVEGTHDYSKSPNGRKIHDFPVIWVGFRGSSRRTPWPAEDVRPL